MYYGQTVSILLHFHPDADGSEQAKREFLAKFKFGEDVIVNPTCLLRPLDSILIEFSSNTDIRLFTIALRLSEGDYRVLTNREKQIIAKATRWPTNAYAYIAMFDIQRALDILNAEFNTNLVLTSETQVLPAPSSDWFFDNSKYKHDYESAIKERHYGTL